MPESSKLALNAGELSDEMAGRPDLSKFQMGLEKGENIRILRVGGNTSRAGFLYVSPSFDEDRKSRLEGFRFDSEQGYALEFSHLKLRILQNGELVESSGSPLEYVTPWTEDQIFKLQFSQRIDKIIVTHPEVETHTITREADDTWTVAVFPWQERIWVTPLQDDITLTPSVVSGSGTLTASGSVFSAAWVGSRIQLNQIKDEETVSGDIPNAGTDVELVAERQISGTWSFETDGNWAGTIKVQRKYGSGGSYSTIKTLISNLDKNFNLTDSEDPDLEVYLKFTFTNTSGGITGDFTFTESSTPVNGVVLVTGHTSGTLVNITVEKMLNEVAPVADWNEDAFSPKNGYAKTSTFHQKRLFFAGSTLRPQSVWGSKTKKPFDFTIGSLDDDGLSFETEARDYEGVEWLVSHLALVIGTTSGVWAITSPDGRSITPLNSATSRQVKVGVEDGIPGMAVSNNILFLQRRGRKIHELTGGSVEYGGYTEVDLTQLASHITRGGVVQMASGEIPDSSLYVVTGEGEIAVLTYERPQNVVGWARWITDGVIESVATCPGAGENDDIYIVVKRGDRRFIEFMSPDMQRKEESNAVADLNFLDSSVVKESETPFTTVEDLDHLEGLTVDLFLDGEYRGNAVVDGGEVELTRLTTKAVVGLPFTALIRPMPLDYGAIGSKSSTYELLVRFRNTQGGEVSQTGEEGTWSSVNFEQPRIVDDSPLPLLTQDVKVSIHPEWNRRSGFSIRQTKPLPITILAIRAKSKTTK